MTTCLNCGMPVVTTTYPDYGTVWIHADGYRVCTPTFAAPDFMSTSD